MFNYFLLTALAALFLSVSHAPDTLGPRCRDEFYMALDLIRSMTPNSFISKRLWRTIRGLKEVGPKLGLRISNGPGSNIPPQQQPPSQADAHSDAAVAMAGLAGHNVSEMAVYANAGLNVPAPPPPQQQQPGMVVGEEDPNGMADDLTNLFEAVGGYSNLLGMPNGGFPAQQAPANVEGMAGPQVTGQHQDELTRILRDLF